MITLLADSVTPQAWHNGGGQTRELLRWPADGPWRLRISLADIAADGPFSGFEGVTRWFAVLSGAGVVLHFDDHDMRLDSASNALQFDGAAAPGCSLIDGPTQDLNLMLRGGATGVLQHTETGEVWDAAWPLRGHFGSTDRCLRWQLPDGPLRAPSAGWWIGVRP
jgi:environmental stress-induced protein Ves